MVDPPDHVPNPGAKSFRPSLAINLPHHNVDAPDDRGYIRDQATAADLVRDAQVAEAARPGPDAKRDRFLTRPADDVETHLPARALGFDVALARRQRSRRFHAV